MAATAAASRKHVWNGNVVETSAVGNWATVTKLPRPKRLTLTPCALDCTRCAILVDYLQTTHGARVTIGRGSAPDGAQLVDGDTKLVVPLPDGLHKDDKATRKTVVQRLQRTFESLPVKPLAHQVALRSHYDDVDWGVRTADQKADLVYWSMGAGKTYGGVTATLHGKNGPASNIMVVCPNSLILPWRDEFARTPLTAGTERPVTVTVLGFTEFKKRAADDRRFTSGCDVIIVDEAHYFRNRTDNMRPAIEALHRARHLMLLSGTPLVNDVGDAAGLLELMDMSGRTAYSEDRPPTVAAFARFLAGHVSHYDPHVHDRANVADLFPTVERRIVKVAMTWSQTLLYLASRRAEFTLCGHTVRRHVANRYNSLLRAISNMPDEADPTTSPKAAVVVENILALSRDGTRPQVVYSSLLDKGIVGLERMLRERGPKERVAAISGKTATRERKRIVDDYNRRRVDDLFLSKALGEGIDLLRTACVHMFEPADNRQAENQVINRAVRYNSHVDADSKTVVVFLYLATFPDMARPPPQSSAEWRDVGRVADDVFGADVIPWASKTGYGLVWRDMARIVADDEGGVAVNERYYADNLKKQADLGPYLEAAQRASIAMPIGVARKAKRKRDDGDDVRPKKRAKKAVAVAATDFFD
jgi:superfamily II DNA or RNA helicase